MNANRRGLGAAFEFLKGTMRLMSMLYRRIKQDKADEELSFVFIDRPLQGENLIWRSNNG